MGFANYTGERPGFFFDPNDDAAQNGPSGGGRYLAIAAHYGAYRNWATGELTEVGAVPAKYSDPSRQSAYADVLANSPTITAAGLAMTDLARSGIPGSPQSVATQPVSVSQPLSTAPAAPGLWESIVSAVSPIQKPVAPGVVKESAVGKKTNWLLWGAAAFGLWLVWR